MAQRQRGRDSYDEDGQDHSQAPWPGRRSGLVPGDDVVASGWPGRRPLTAYLARWSTGAPPARVPGAVRTVLERESGTPLAGGRDWSARLGADVSDARLVTGDAAERAAESIDARAFTVGNRIFFGAGATPSSDSLLAHELTHVAQQRGATMPSIDQLAFTSPGDAVEHEARDAEGGTIAATGQVAIARDEQYMVTADYIARWHDRIGADVRTRLGDLGAGLVGRLATPNVTWVSDAMPIIRRVQGGLGGDAVTTLRQLVAPQTLETLVDRGRQITRTSGDHITAGSDQWSIDVATAIAEQVVRNLGDALSRVSPRYLAARGAAQQRAWAQAHATDPGVQPQPATSDIVPGHPVDRFVIDAACSGEAFNVDLVAWRAANPALANATSAVHAVVVTLERVSQAPETDPGNFWVWFHASMREATAEDVAQSIFGDTAQAFRFGVRTPPLFACTADSIFTLPAATRDRIIGMSPALQAERDRRDRADDARPHLIGFMGPRRFVDDPEGQPPTADPTAGLPGAASDQAALSSAQGAGTAMPARPGAAPAATRSREQILSQMGENKVILQRIVAMGQRFEVSESFGPAGGHIGPAIQTVIQRLDDRRTRLAAASEADVQPWDAHAREQSQILGAVVGGLTQANQLADQMERDAGGDGHQLYRVDRATRLPLTRVAGAYLSAAASSDLPDTARQQLDEAERQSQLYPTAMMELILQEVQAAIAGVHNRASYGADEMRTREEQLRTQIADLRQAILARSPDVRTRIQQILSDVQDLQTETSMVANMDGLDEAWRQMGDLADSFGVWGEADRRLRALQAEAVTWKAGWTEIYRAWIAATRSSPSNPAAKRQVIDRFNEFRQRAALAEFLGRVQAAMRTAEQQAMIARLIALLAIMVVTAGAGSAVAGFVGAEGLGWGAVATGAAQVGTESLVFAGLNEAVLETHPTFQHFSVEFGVNVIMFGALRGVSAALRGAHLGEFMLRDMRGFGAIEVGAQGLSMGAMSVARARIAAELGGQPSPQDAQRIFLESAAEFIALSVLMRAGQPYLQRLQNASGRLGAMVREANAARTALAARAQAVQTSRDARSVDELLQRDRESLQRDIDTLNELKTTARDNPEILRAQGMTAEEIAALSAELGGGILRLQIAQLMQGVENIGGEFYAAPRDRMPDLLARHQRLGAVVRVTGRDAQTGARQYRIEYAEGTRYTMFERAPSTPAPGSGDTPPTSDEAAAARAAADEAARIQARRDDQATALFDSATNPIFDTVIIGAGQTGTLAQASASGTGAPPGVDVTTLPRVVNVAPEGSMFARHGDFQTGQRPGEQASPAMTHQPGEYTSDHGHPTQASDHVRALTMTGYENGMVTIKHTVEAVEQNPRDGSWPVDAPLRVRINGQWAYTQRVIGAMGLGAPTPASFAGATELAARGKLVYAQETLTLPGGHAREIVVIGGGASGMWACEAALRQGATRIIWSGRPDPSAAVPDAVRADLRARGLTDEQITAFYRASNARNADTFNHVGREIQLSTVSIDSAELLPSGRVRVQVGGVATEVDGIVVAAGQSVTLPQGMQSMRFRLVVSDYNGRPRLTALDAVDARGNPTGIRLEGAQIMNRGMADLVVDAEQARYQQLVDEMQRDAPGDSRGVPGSIYQTNINVPLANQQPIPGPRGAAPTPPPGAVPMPGDDDRRSSTY